jgi:hypothetical protein
MTGVGVHVLPLVMKMLKAPRMGTELKKTKYCPMDCVYLDLFSSWLVIKTSNLNFKNL